MPGPERGIVLTAAEIQSEGVAPVLDAIAATGATAIETALGVVAVGAPGDGTREPPLDVEGQVRLLDRPLWGRREIYLKSYTPHPPDPDIWRYTGYSPPRQAPPELRVDVTRQTIEAARARGLAVYLRVSPFTLPGAPGGQTVDTGQAAGPSDDRPLRLDNRAGERVVAGHGCLNRPRVRALGEARLREALRHYPDVDGIMLDWPEYTCYFLEDCFTCFCDACREAASAASIDWARVRRDSQALWDRLHRLTAADLARAGGVEDWPFALAAGLLDGPGVADLLRFKALSARRALADLRATMDEAGHRDMTLGASGFAPPWCLITGMHYGLAGQVVQVTRAKLFTFHWPMIARWWSETLLAWNPALGPTAVLRAVVTALDLPAPANEHRRDLAEYGMPRPDEFHPITPEALTRKLDQAVALAGEAAPCQAYLHGYRPAAEFAQHLQAAAASRATGVWVQRYGYLSDEKLALLREAWRG